MQRKLAKSLLASHVGHRADSLPRRARYSTGAPSEKVSTCKIDDSQGCMQQDRFKMFTPYSILKKATPYIVHLVRIVSENDVNCKWEDCLPRAGFI